MIKHPLAEVFGYPVSNQTDEASRCRRNCLCRFNNKVPNCTKDKANDPLGVCSIFDGESVVITCPVRFREKWIIAEDAASFFFPSGTKWTTLTEVRLKDAQQKSAGNIDVVLCAYDERGKVTDFGALEVQAVYISGNIRNPFEFYMTDPTSNMNMEWKGRPNYPTPDYLSSSRKRLAPQLIFKGGILKVWGKKTAVAINKGFFETLPQLESVPADDADIAWFVYDLARNESENTFALKRLDPVYTRFDDSLQKITQSEPGKISDFLELLQRKVDDKLDENPPDTETISASF
jgi:hypothetical protein